MKPLSNRIVSALACLVLALPSSAQDAALGTEIVGALTESSVEADRDGALARRVGALGYAALEVAFGAIANLEILVEAEDGEVERRALAPVDALRLETALLRLDASDLRAFVRARGERELSSGERKLVLRLLKSCGARADLQLAARAADAPGDDRIPRSDRSLFQECFAAIYARDGALAAELGAVYRGAPVDLAAPVIWAIGQADSVRGFEHLTILLGMLPEADPLILAELTRLASVLPHPLPGEAADAARGYLNSSQLEHLLVAIRAAQEFEDSAATARLIELSDHRVKAVANAAVGALKRLSGIDRGRGSDRWKEWYLKTQRWWQWEAPGLLDAIKSGGDAEASRALLEISKWRFYRHEIAPQVAKVLERQDPELLVLACAVLGHLGSWVVVPNLVSAIEDPNADIRSAAVQALRRITGEDFGIDRDAWLELLQARS